MEICLIGKLFLDIIFKFKRIFKAKKVEIVNFDLDLEFGILKKTTILKGEDYFSIIF